MDENISKFKKFKFEYVVVIVLLIAVVCVIFFTFGGEKSTASANTETEKYVTALEKKLSDALSKVDGAGKVSVVITVSSGIATEIAEDRKTVSENGKTTSTSTPVLVSGKPVVLREVYPEITGVVIVAKGADKITVKMSMLDAATKVLGITADKIHITS